MDTAETRYTRYREARDQILQAASQRIPLASLGTQARALGLWRSGRVQPGTDAQLALVFDLGVLDPLAGHQAAIERQAKVAPPPEGTPAARMLDALRQARFSLWRLRGRHDLGGAAVEDLCTGEPAWVMDSYLAAHGIPGQLFGARLAWPDEFAMTCGVITPVTARVLRRLLDGGEPDRGPVLPAGDVDPLEPAIAALLEEEAAVMKLKTLPQDPMFAAKAYRAALDFGLMGPVPGRSGAVIPAQR